MNIRISIFIPFVLAACATKPENDPAYVAATLYESYSCSQMQAEKQHLSTQIDQAMKSDKQNQVLGAAVAIFAISQGMGVSSDDNVELKRLNNKFMVLEETMIRKDCL